MTWSGLTSWPSGSQRQDRKAKVAASVRGGLDLLPWQLVDGRTVRTGGGWGDLDLSLVSPKILTKIAEEGYTSIVEEGYDQYLRERGRLEPGEAIE